MSAQTNTVLGRQPRTCLVRVRVDGSSHWRGKSWRMDRVLELRNQGRAGGKMNLDEELESTRADDEFDEEKVNLPRGPRQNSLRGVGGSVIFIQIYARAYRALFLHQKPCFSVPCISSRLISSPCSSIISFPLPTHARHANNNSHRTNTS